MTTFAEFAEKRDVTMTATYVGLRAEKGTEGKPWHHFEWSVQLHHGSASYTATYRSGVAHCQRVPYGIGAKGPLEPVTHDVARALKPHGKVTLSDVEGYVRPTAPELAEVLQSLASDASGALNAGTFEAWASDYGYDSDSRKAEKIYEACKGVHFELSRLLGLELCAELYTCEEG
jgi:hypothetical protein